MNVQEVFADSVRASGHMLGKMAADLTPEQLHWNPPGTAHGLAATLAHAALATDWQIHTVFGDGQPLFETTWAGRTGVSETVSVQTLAWAQSVRVDIAAFKTYSGAIYAELDEWLANLSDEDLLRPVDMSFIGAGERTLGWSVNMVVVAHLNNLVGEAAAVRGMQGLQGYMY